MANYATSNDPHHSPEQGTPNKPGTFTTDVSETDDQGTTVRETQVREDDLSEVDSSERGDKE
ncbi:hypothetical protein KQH60_12110 [Mycetohabitans sp. B8]|uniref:hypothetical protein n=1 Tax=Mycetohabitans sp. B8 TaxID=2841845 RepID=UPI001F338377|nr:hypothetical protein [Mycetohabitans sp. B8]MCG1043240.1 hypothetical protein [Mycetohabitans sp. B8]